MLARVGGYLLVDEVYLECLFRQRPESCVHAGPNVLVTNSLTKAYGLDGLRAGWILGPQTSRRAGGAHQRSDDEQRVAPGEQMALAAFRRQRVIDRARTSDSRSESRRVCGGFSSGEPRLQALIPEGGNVMFPRLPAGIDSDRLASRLVDRYSTLVVPGRFFEAPRHIRISFGCRPSLLEPRAREHLARPGRPDVGTGEGRERDERGTREGREGRERDERGTDPGAAEPTASLPSDLEENVTYRRVYALAALIVLCVTVIPRGQSRTVKALVGGTLIDGNASRPIQNSVVIVDGDRIRAVGQVGSLAVPAGAEVISTEGMTVLPGLWDMHVHLQILGHSDYDHWDKTYPPAYESVIFPTAAKQLLLAGVTSARDLGGPLEPSISTRDRINAGKIPGPTMYVSGPFIQHAPYPGTESYRWGVSGPEDARAKVRKLVEGKVDVIKLIDQDDMTMEEVRAVVDEAHKHGKQVVAHAHRPEEIRRALAAGVDCLEHTGLATAPEYPPDIIAMIRERTAKMSLGPLWWTPTAEGLLNYEYFRDNPEALDDPAWQEGLPKDIVDDIRKSIEHPDRLPYYPADADASADAGAQVQSTARGGRDAADRDRQRDSDELPHALHVA